jgi:hypothetical protein
MTKKIDSEELLSSELNKEELSATDIESLLELYLEKRIQIKKLLIEIKAIKENVFIEKTQYRKDGDEYFLFKNGKVYLKKQLSGFTDKLKKEFNELSIDQKRDLYRTGLLVVKFKLNKEKYEEFKKKYLPTLLDKYVVKKEDVNSEPYSVVGRINQNITKRLYELLKNLSPENQDTLEDFENEEDDGEDAYVFYDELTNKEYFIDGVLVDDSELDN